MTDRLYRRRNLAAPRQSGNSAIRGVIFIGAPLVVLIGLFVGRGMESAPEASDENVEIACLEKQIDELQAEFAEVAKTMRGGRGAGTKRAKELQSKLEAWLSGWGAIFDPKRDANGDLPAELQGYERVPAPVATMRVDLLKMMGF